MASEQSKGEREIAVFLRFLAKSQLPVDPESVQKRTWPEPDILCTHATDGPLAFELTEICDPLLARSIAQASEAYLRTSDPSASIIDKKLGRSYQTPFPIELLCYTDGRVVTPDNMILATIRPRLTSFRRTFRRAWLLGRTGVHHV